VEGSDVTIRYSFLPTEDSIRESADRVVKQLNRSGGRPISNAMGKKLANESDKTVNSIINFLRATQQKTSLQTKILSGLKFLEPYQEKIRGMMERLHLKKEFTPAISPAGVGKGEGGAIVPQAGSGGGMIGALGMIVGLLTVISVVMMIIGAFFDAVGPIIKVVMKMLSAVILILLMPFLKRGLPVLFGILNAVIQFSKLLSNFVDKFLTYMEGAFGELAAGNPMGLIKLWLGPIGMVGIELLKLLIQFLSKVNWGEVINTIVKALGLAFITMKDIVKGLIITLFGEPTWNTIKAAVKFIQGIFDKDGIWKKIQEAVDFIGESVFGKGLWDTMKQSFYDIVDMLEQIYTMLGDAWDRTLGQVFGKTHRTASPSELLAIQEAAGILTKIKTSNGVGGNISVTPANINPAQQAINNKYNAIYDKAAGVNQDFISRPGMGVQSFSPNDTIIGTKGGIGGGTNITNNLYVSAGVDKNEFRKILSDFNREQARELRMRTSYAAGFYS
jgi:hypothetical protein